MADDNRLPTNQSQLDIAEELSNIKLAIQQLFVMQNKADLTTIAPAENQIASAAHLTDDIFTYNGGLYQATEDIAIGDDITNKITQISTTSYVNPTRMNHIEQGIYDTYDMAEAKDVEVISITSGGTPRATDVVNKSIRTGKQVIICATFTSAYTGTNTPSILLNNTSPSRPSINCVLNCIEIDANGNIVNSIPCYIGTTGAINIKTVTNGSKYVVTGCYAIN